MKKETSTNHRTSTLKCIFPFIVRHLAVPRICRSLTGRPRDLQRLIPLSRFSNGNPGLSALLNRLAHDLETRTGLAELFLRVGRVVNQRSRRKLVENLIYNWGVGGLQKRERNSTKDMWVPSLLVVSPTMRCNLHCTGCYSGLYSKQQELSERDLDRLFTECRRLGIYFVVISGGEPYLLRDSLFRLFHKFNDMYFLTYTNGTLLNEETVRSIARLGNVSPAISVEGYELHTDRRRGVGVYQDIMRAMALLRREGVLFGISVTYNRENLEVVTSKEFVQTFIRQGALFGWYFMFMPVGKDPNVELVPLPEQRVECGRRIENLRSRYPIFLADFWNDGPAVGGCLAAGRSYLHILNTGKVEPCVFAHFGVDNIHETTLLEAANSPFFRSIRSRFPYNETANLKRPCMIIDNPEVLREAVADHRADSGHRYSEAIVADPGTIGWIDRYASRFKELTEPLWEKQISDPADRWYRNGPEYRTLLETARSRLETGQAAGGHERTLRAPVVSTERGAR